MKEWLARRRGSLVTALLLLPAFGAFFGLFFYPFVVTFVMSLRPEGQQSGWTIQHYITFISDPHGRSVVALTFGLAIATTLLSVLLSVPLSLVLRRKLRGHRMFRIMILVPMVVPGLIAALGLLLFYGPRGWFILFFRDVLSIGENWRIVYTLPGLTMFYVWLYFPYTCLTTLAALESIDPGIEEAAEVAGADRWKVLRHILLPLIAPGILSGSVLTFMAAFGAFSIPLVAGGNYRPLAVEIYKQIELFIPARWSQASAMAVLMGVMQVVFLAIYMRFLRTERVTG